MFNFLRKLRQKEFSGRYLRYAIGEIVLVVIGILIALSINNWNEDRKTKVKEQFLLTQLKSSFENNLEQLQQKINIRDRQLNSCLSMLEMIDHKTTRNDSLFNYHLTETLTYTTFDPVALDFSDSDLYNLISDPELKLLLSHWTTDVLQVTEEELNFKKFREEHYVPFVFKHYQIRTARSESYQRNFLKDYLIEDQSKVVRHIGTSNYETDINQLLDQPDFEDLVTRTYHIINVTNLQSTPLENSILKILDVINRNL